MSSLDDATSTDTSQIQDWRSIVTLVVFVLANLAVLFPFDLPIYVPRPVSDANTSLLRALRIIPPRRPGLRRTRSQTDKSQDGPFVRKKFPVNFITAPLIGDLFLLAILAIGRQEVYDGTVGVNGISPIDIMAFFITLAYIAISVDASGLIRYLAFKVVQKGGKVGHRLFFYLYAFFFGLGSFIGNDPIILSGTAFLAYMTRVSSNIVHPRAWIHTQFAIANIASAILVSSNPTNLVLAGAFQVKFIIYTANMIVPVVATAIVLFPFLLYIVFANESLIPLSIKIHELPEEVKSKSPVNPNIPNARGSEGESEIYGDDEKGKLLSLEEVMNPFLDKGGAGFGALIMATTLITLLALNAHAQSNAEYPVFWVTLPGAFVLFSWDLAFGWLHRHETRDIARKGREDIQRARIEQTMREEEKARINQEQQQSGETGVMVLEPPDAEPTTQSSSGDSDTKKVSNEEVVPSRTLGNNQTSPPTADDATLKAESTPTSAQDRAPSPFGQFASATTDEERQAAVRRASVDATMLLKSEPSTLVSLSLNAYRWAQETFPTVMAVMAHLPFPLVPFALSMFVLVQALVSKGWVAVFAYGWDHWVTKTGTVGAIGGMGFLSVILCNFAGTNIGTTILLSRVIQAWQAIHYQNQIHISDRTFWGTVYGMALGVNFGAFSTAFSASLAGLLWRDILARKHIRVRRLEFARVNLPIIAIAMAVGSAVLIGEVYIKRTDEPYSL